MLACFLCGFSYLGMTDREAVVPFAAGYFKNALVGYAQADTDKLQKVVHLMRKLGDIPHPAGIFYFFPLLLLF